MRFIAILPLLVAGVFAEGLKEVPTIDTAALGDHIVQTNFEQSAQLEQSGPHVQACPPGFPLYCPTYGWCCTLAAVSCCPRSCCGAGTQFCGADGNCYRWA